MYVWGGESARHRGSGWDARQKFATNRDSRHSPLATYTTLRGTSLEDSLMGVGRGERNYVLGTRNIFQLKSAKQEREAKFGTRERESWYAKKKL